MSESPLVFLILDHGDQWVRLDQIVRMARRTFGERSLTEIQLLNGHRFTVPEDLAGVEAAIVTAQEKT